MCECVRAGRWGCRGQRLRAVDGRGVGAESRSANTACCHKHNRYMSGLGSVRERGRTNVGGKEGGEMVKEV